MVSVTTKRLLQDAWIYAFLPVLATGCTTYVLSSVRTSPSAPSDPAVATDLPAASTVRTQFDFSSASSPDVRMSSLLAGAADWFVLRRYTFCTNEPGGIPRLTACFASSEITNCGYHCHVTANKANELLSFTAVADGALASASAKAVFALLCRNSDSAWGHYGFDPEGANLFFKVTILHLDGQVRPEEMDRLLDAALKAMDLALKRFGAHKDTDNEEQSNPQNEPHTQPAFLEI